MIYPFSFTCPRDWDCFEFLVESAESLHDTRMAPFIAYHDSKEPPDERMKAFASAHRVKLWERVPGFAPWSEESGWSKFHGFLRMLQQSQLKDDDYVVHIDSDCFFTSSEIIDQLHDCDLAGFEHGEGRDVLVLDRTWTWCSGAFQAARVGFWRRHEDELENWSRSFYDELLMLMRDAGLSTVNDDVVTSFLFAYMGAKTKNLGPWGGVADLEAIALGKEKPRSLVHYANDKRNFLGISQINKWEFIRILKMKNIKLF